MPGATVKSGATVQYSIIAENVVVEEGAVVGERPEECADLSKWGVSVVGAKLTVGKGAKVTAAKMIDKNVEEGETI